MRRTGLLIKVAVILPVVLLLAGTAAGQPPQVHVPVPAGWTAVDEEYRYDRENLWEYINGAAELFLNYGFRELIVQDIEQGEQYLSISVYDMGRPLDAYGVFETESPRDAARLEGIGAAAVLQPPYRGLMLKQRFYVKAEIGGGDVTEQALSEVLHGVADGLPGDDALPPQLASLPDDGRVPGTVAFAGNSYLGLSELSNCLHADYETADGAGYELFVLKPSKSLLANKRWTRERGPGGQSIMWRQIPYSGVVVLMGDEQEMTGIAGCETYDEAVALLSATGE